MKVIILAAGVGERLFPLTRNTPKSLVHIGNGMTILESQLQAIDEAGVRDVVIVGGYLVEQIEAKIQHYRHEHDLNIEVVFNPFYDVSNNLASLWFAKHEMRDADGFVVVNGDDIFRAHVLKGLLDEPEEREICAVVSKKDEYDADDMKIVLHEGAVRRMSKQIPPIEAQGESIGMIRVTGKAVRRVARQLEAMMRLKENLDVFWLEAFNALAGEGWAIHPYEIEPKDWAEMDFHPDVDVVRQRLEESLGTMLDEEE